MRQLVLSLIATAAAWAADPGRPFSHALHLKAKPDCGACHAAAAGSTKVSDNLLPSAASCTPCHREVTIQPPAATNLVKFSHRDHLRFGNIAPLLAAAVDSGTYLSPPGDMRRFLNGTNPCAACHRGMNESERVTKANHPQMADCLVCHNRVDPPFSCTTCHAEDANLKPASHTPDYLDSHNRMQGKLDKASCAVCHGRSFTCLGCH